MEHGELRASAHTPRVERGMTMTGKVSQGLNKAGAVVGGIGELGLPGGEAVSCLEIERAFLLSGVRVHTT